MAGVRDDSLNSRKQGSQTGEQASAGATIRHAGRFRAACDRQAQGIDEDVALASLYPLVLSRCTILCDNRGFCDQDGTFRPNSASDWYLNRVLRNFGAGLTGLLS